MFLPKCSVTCGVGQQYRSLECVWKFTEDSAGDACNTKSIPQTVKQCKQVSCVTTTTTPIPVLRGMYGKNGNTIIHQLLFSKYSYLCIRYFTITDESCKDTSKYCGLIVSFKMCHKDKYKRQCCSSCT